MNEALVQWTLLNNINYLGKILKFDIKRKVAQEFTTHYGRIDSIVENKIGRQLIVELETDINSLAKLEYCFNQLRNYKNVKLSGKTDYCILYAEETSIKMQKLLREFAKDNNLIPRTYSLDYVQKLYPKTIERLSLSYGLALPKPKNYTISYLRLLNKILKTFFDKGKSCLTFTEIYMPFQSKTNFNCYLRLAQDFELINIIENLYYLTNYGVEFINNFNPLIIKAENPSSVELTSEQKRLLLKILTNGNWTTYKVNIYWFLKFMEIKNGDWLPKTNLIDDDKLEVVNGLFGVNYKKRTMSKFLRFAGNWCYELGLVEIVQDAGNSNKVFLTPLGVEISNIFGLDIQLKKTRFNLSFKYLD